MAIINKTIDDGASGSNDPGNYEVELLGVPPGSRYAVTTIMVCNPHTGTGETLTFDLHLVDNGVGGAGVSDTRTIVVKDLTLPAGETFTFDSEKVVLDENQSVVISSTPVNGNALAATISYLEV